MIALKLWPPIESLSEEGYVDPLRPDETPKGAAIESSNGPTEPAAEDPASLEKALGLVVKNGVHHRLHVHVETVKTCLGVLEDQEIVEKIDIGDAADKDQIAEVLATASNTLNDLRALQVNRDEETAANDSGSPIQQSGASQCNKLQKLLEAAEKEEAHQKRQLEKITDPSYSKDIRRKILEVKQELADIKKTNKQLENENRRRGTKLTKEVMECHEDPSTVLEKAEQEVISTH
eukprot:GHVU01127687.1.p1 GENE.GHVU01127687.1~~GHVU01127687.1.p1  ORF type:complete len:234 (+),score=47.25 GHVU01127687.1:187-888(+)